MRGFARWTAGSCRRSPGDKKKSAATHLCDVVAAPVACRCPAGGRERLMCAVSIDVGYPAVSVRLVSILDGTELVVEPLAYRPGAAVLAEDV